MRNSLKMFQDLNIGVVIKLFQIILNFGKADLLVYMIVLYFNSLRIDGRFIESIHKSWKKIKIK